MHPDKAVRDAAEPCLQKYTTLQTEIFQDEKLYARVNAAQPDEPAPGQAQEGPPRGLRGQRRGAAAGQARAGQGDLRQARGAAPGLRPRHPRRSRPRSRSRPPRWRACPRRTSRRKKRDDQGNYRPGARLPVVLPVHAEREERRGAQALLRREAERRAARRTSTACTRSSSCARSWRASTACRRSPTTRCAARWSRTPQTVDKFLDDVKGAVTDLEKKEIEELRAEKAKDLGTPLADTKRRALGRALLPGEACASARFDIDQEKLRKYFPTDKSVDYTLARLAAPLRREVPRGEGARVESRRALLRRARREDRQVPVGLLPRPLPARGQVQPRRGLPAARRQHARAPHAARGARHQLRPQRA